MKLKTVSDQKFEIKIYKFGIFLSTEPNSYEIE